MKPNPIKHTISREPNLHTYQKYSTTNPSLNGKSIIPVTDANTIRKGAEAIHSFKLGMSHYHPLQYFFKNNHLNPLQTEQTEQYNQFVKNYPFKLKLIGVPYILPLVKFDLKVTIYENQKTLLYSVKTAYILEVFHLLYNTAAYGYTKIMLKLMCAFLKENIKKKLSAQICFTLFTYCIYPLILSQNETQWLIKAYQSIQTLYLSLKEKYNPQTSEENRHYIHLLHLKLQQLKVQISLLHEKKLISLQKIVSYCQKIKQFNNFLLWLKDKYQNLTEITTLASLIDECQSRFVLKDHKKISNTENVSVLNDIKVFLQFFISSLDKISIDKSQPLDHHFFVRLLNSPCGVCFYDFVIQFYQYNVLSSIFYLDLNTPLHDLQIIKTLLDALIDQQNMFKQSLDAQVQKQLTSINNIKLRKQQYKKLIYPYQYLNDRPIQEKRDN